MKQHTQGFKNGLIELGREVSVLITYGETTLTNEDLYSVNPNYETELLKSIMTGVDITSYVDVPVGTVINLKWGIKVGENFEYLDYGNFTVYSSERQEDKNTYKIVAYDGMLASMKEYNGLSIDFPCTIQTFVGALANDLGWNYTPTEFTNYDKQIQDLWCIIDEENQKKSMGYTYRDVLDDINEATATNSIVTNNELKLVTVNETNETLPEDFIKTTSTEFSTFGPINAVVLSRSSSDNIYARDTDSIETNGLYEIKISDNQILNNNNRNEYLEGIYSALHNLSFKICDFSTCGVGYLEPLDKFSITIGETTYDNIIMLNSDLKISDGIVEDIYANEPSQSETDYTKADTTDQRLNQTTLIVDKQNQRIDALVTNVTDNTTKVAQLSLDVAELRSEIGDVTDITNMQEGYGSLTFENINESEPIDIEIHPMADSNIAYLYPANNLYPSSNLFPKNRILKFTNTETDETWEYLLPDNLRYYNTNTYDKFVLSYENEICQVTKKVGINADRSKYALTTEEVIDYTYPHIGLTQGNYIVELVGYPNAYIKVRLMSQNMYTSQFATKVEMNSKISQKADEITSEVATTYLTKGEGDVMSSRITQNANSIETKVSKGAVISTINQSAESIQINANKISLER